jgi:hypothetical protein
MEKKDIFYFVFGETLTENQPGWVVRFYFNIHPKGSPHLIAALCRAFNRYGIPFEFKCLNRPDLYTRTDAAVLYLDNRYYTIGLALLGGIYRELQAYFQAACPLFTRKIAPGFGFAENPLNPQESFGTSRSRLIARSLAAAFNEGLDKQLWKESVLSAIGRDGYELQTFYLNPGSHYSYHFEL